MSLFNWKKTKLYDFRLKISYMTSKKNIILAPIEYQKQNFIIQTPMAFMLRSLPESSIGKKFYKTSLFFEHYAFNKKTLEFIDKINEIETFIIDKYYKESKKVIYSIKKTHSNQDVFFNLNIQIFNNKLVLPIFDSKKQNKSIDYILPRSRTINIVYLKDVWNRGEQVGFNWILLQTKVYLPFLHIKECLIVEEPKIFVKAINYSKYFKMQKFGVPEEAIKTELEKNNLSYSDFIKCKLKNNSKR